MARSVAIIEPDTNVASHVEAAFHTMGFETHVLADGDVVEFVRQRAPVVILLNVELARGSGYSFCNRLKKQQDLKRIPIILTSGQETPEAFAQHQKTPTPADAYIHKPFSIDQLIDAVGRLVPEAFPNGAPLAAQLAVPGNAAPAPPQGGGEAGAAASGGERAAGAPPPRPGRGRPDPARASGPTFDELLAQGRTDEPMAAPAATAGPEAKLTFLRESLRRREQDIVKARDLWAQRDREMGQLAEMLDLRERELERARKAREDLLAQLTDAEDRIGALRLDVELGSERAERLEREKKALAEELEQSTNDAERQVGQLTARVANLEDALRVEQALRTEENERSGTEIRDLVTDLENARADFARRDAAARERETGFHKKISEVQARIAELDVQLETANGKLADSNKTVEALRRDLGTLRDKKVQDDSAFRARIDELEGRLGELSLDKDGVEQELARTVADLADTRARLDDRTSRILDLEADLADTQGQLSETRAQLEHSETRGAELSADLADAQQEALALSQQKHKLEQKVAELGGNLGATAKRLEETLTELEDNRKKTTAHARELESRVVELKASVADRDARLNEQSAALTSVQATLRDVESRLADKTRDWDQERVGRQKDVLKRDQRIADLDQKLRELEAALHDAERQAKTRDAGLIHELDAAHARADELDRDLNRAVARSNELEGLVQTGRDKIADLTRELRRAEGQGSAVRDELKLLREKLDEATQALAEARDRNAFLEAELSEERATHSQDVQAQTANLERIERSMKDRLEKLQEAHGRLKSEFATAQSTVEQATAQWKQAEAQRAALEAQVERTERERRALADRIGVLDDEIEDAQANNEKLQDELTRVRTQAKRAIDDLTAMKREKANLEADFAEKEGSLFKRVEENKASVAEEKQKGRAELEAARKERDEAKARVAEIRTKAEAALKRAREIEAAAAERAESVDQALAEVQNELRIEREARAREKAQAEAAQEKLQKQLADASRKASSVAEDELDLLRDQLREKEEKLARAAQDVTQQRERAREAAARVKDLTAQLANANGTDDQTRKAIDDLRAKHNENVGKLKNQVEVNRQINEKYQVLSEKHRKALALIDELKRRPSNAVPLAPPPVDLDDEETLGGGGESTLVLPNPLLKGRP